eukprot:3170246-Amphidinium_carterae.1
MKVVKLTSVVENLCRDNNVSLSKVYFCKIHLSWEKKTCADPCAGPLQVTSLLSYRNVVTTD